MVAVVALSVFASMRTSPIDAMHTKAGIAAGLARGELAGAAANWMALIKMMAPQVFRLMSERAHRTGGDPGGPFFLAAAAAALSQLLLSAGGGGGDDLGG